MMTTSISYAPAFNLGVSPFFSRPPQRQNPDRRRPKTTKTCTLRRPKPPSSANTSDSTPWPSINAPTMASPPSTNAPIMTTPASNPSSTNIEEPAPPRRQRGLSTRAIKIVCVGDIHGQWDAHDETAVRALEPDLTLFVGDYGDEDVNVTRRIAHFAANALFDVATVFGNHDAFFTASPTKRGHAPYDVSSTCRVSQQIAMLAPYDVSYSAKPFESSQLSVVGGRSFSHGGPHWRYKQFFRRFVGVESLTQSTARLCEAVDNAQFDTIVFLSHSGPVGLGDRPCDPCGKDWGPTPGGDYGDLDLRRAIDAAREARLRVPLTVFGHMHKDLQSEGGGERIMVKTEPDGQSGRQTVMLNAAVVPRHKTVACTNGPNDNKMVLHNFQVVHMQPDGDVSLVEECWVSGCGEMVESTVIFKAAVMTSV